MINKKPLILIVDDNPENIHVLGEALKSEKYSLSIALNGETALKMIDKEPPNLILLDVMMPGLNGFQVCEQLKTNPKTKDIEIIFITAATDLNRELKGLELGAVDYIHKPFSNSIVQSKVELHLERAKSKKELQLKNEALEKINQLQHDIEQITHHDLKSPLSVIINYSQLLFEDCNISKDDKLAFLKSIYDAGNKMLYMINHSLDLYKMEMKTYKYSPEPISINNLIKNIIRDFQLPITAKKLDICIENVENDDFDVLAENHLSYSLFANLIRNAIEASDNQDTIKIKMFYEAEDAVVFITNSGSVPTEIRTTFFEKYTTSGKKNGNGLGTYSAKLMTETQNGTISMNTNDKETCLTIRLPKC